MKADGLVSCEEEMNNEAEEEKKVREKMSDTGHFGWRNQHCKLINYSDNTGDIVQLNSE